MRFAGSDSAMASLFGGVKSPEYDKLANLGTESRGMLEQTAMQADAHVRKSEKQAEGLIEQAEYAGAAAKAQGAAQGQSSMMSGISSGIAGIAGGFGSMGGTGGATPSSSYGYAGLNSGGAFAPSATNSQFNVPFSSGINWRG